MRTLTIAATTLGAVAALALPASADSYRSLVKENPVAKDVWTSSGDNVRHKPSGMECATDQGTATLTFLKTLQGDEGRDVVKTGCRYDLPSGASWNIEISPATNERTDDTLLQFGTAARAEVGGLVGVAPGPIVTPAPAKSGYVVPYALGIFSETSRKRSSIWFGEVGGWRIVATARLYDDSIRKEVEQQAADGWALAAAGVANTGKPPKTD